MAQKVSMRWSRAKSKNRVRDHDSTIAKIGLLLARAAHARDVAAQDAAAVAIAALAQLREQSCRRQLGVLLDPLDDVRLVRLEHRSCLGLLGIGGRIEEGSAHHPVMDAQTPGDGADAPPF